ncbi:MAG: 50S ribosomal protein L9 [Methyloligellaceae bacterium]
MEIILLERIGKLGQMGDVVHVKDGFARNFLLPQGKALRATKSNMKRFEEERAQLEARNLELKNEATAVSEKVDATSYIIIRQAGDTGQLYGSVSTRDIAEAVTTGGCSIDRGQVLLDRPIKTLGVHPVRLSLHPEVQASITVNVARSEDEAELQSRGEDIMKLHEDDGEKPKYGGAAEDFYDDEDEADKPAENTEAETEEKTEEA